MCLRVRSMGNRELDLSYITSRLIVMSYPAEGIESAYRNHLEDVRGESDVGEVPAPRQSELSSGAALPGVDRASHRLHSLAARWRHQLGPVRPN